MPDRSRTAAPSPSTDEAGIALIMVVIFSVLLFVLVADLVTSAQMSKSTGRNDALQVRMDNHMAMTELEVEQGLKDDLEGGGEGAMPGGGEGGANPLGGGAGAGAGAGAGGEGGAGGEEEEPPADSRNDAWYKPTPYSDGDLTTYAYVEDENRKFNILSLASPDKEFAEESKERLIRLIVSLRENTLFEISNSDATTIADEIEDWLNGLNRDDMNRPKPLLKSDDENDPRKTIPLHMEELLLLRGIDENNYFDLIAEGPPARLLPGLESVLTIYTWYRTDPGDPEQNARNNPGGNQPGPGGTGQGGAGQGGTGQGGTGQGGTGGASNPGAGGEQAPQPEGIGIKININTASRHVLRCLLPETEFPNNVLDAILRWRNEDAPEEEGAEGEAAAVTEDYAGDVMEGMEPDKKIFATLEGLEEIPEFASLDPETKDKFLAMVTTESDVFTIHLACLFKKNEERKLFVMSRRKSVVVRLEGEESPRLYYIIRMERCHGLRILDVDFPEEEAERRLNQEMDMDEFAIEERGWNPFLIEFYEKQDEAERQRVR